jgi:hypothetical protein
VRYLSPHLAFLADYRYKNFMNSGRRHFGDSNHAVHWQWKRPTRQYALPIRTRNNAERTHSNVCVVTRDDQYRAVGLSNALAHADDVSRRHGFMPGRRVGFL